MPARGCTRESARNSDFGACGVFSCRFGGPITHLGIDALSEPAMTEREIFAAALHHRNAAERAAFLGAACAGDAALRQRVESLLAEHEQLGSFMEFPMSQATIDQPPSERIGTMIGPYKLL